MALAGGTTEVAGFQIPANPACHQTGRNQRSALCQTCPGVPTPTEPGTGAADARLRPSPSPYAWPPEVDAAKNRLPPPGVTRMPLSRLPDMG